jgi:hypothetical protein
MVRYPTARYPTPHVPLRVPIIARPPDEGAGASELRLAATPGTAAPAAASAMSVVDSKTLWIIGGVAVLLVLLGGRR